MSDLELADVIKYALAAGTGDMVTEWDPHAGFYGTIKLNARGGGGTMFGPVVDYLNGLDEQPACVIWLTDLESGDRPKAPEAPVIFATPGYIRTPAPFGEVVRMTL